MADLKKIKTKIKEALEIGTDLSPTDCEMCANEITNIVKNNDAVVYSVNSAELSEVLKDYKGGLAIVTLTDSVANEISVEPITETIVRKRLIEVYKAEQIQTIQETFDAAVGNDLLTGLSQEQIDAIVAAAIARKTA